jgi:hypothetical protein
LVRTWGGGGAVVVRGARVCRCRATRVCVGCARARCVRVRCAARGRRCVCVQAAVREAAGHHAALRARTRTTKDENCSPRMRP